MITTNKKGIKQEEEQQQQQQEEDLDNMNAKKAIKETTNKQTKQ